MKIKITDRYNDDSAKFDSLQKAYDYFMDYDKECEGDWWPLITIDGAWVPLEEFFVMYKERKCK